MAIRVPKAAASADANKVDSDYLSSELLALKADRVSQDAKVQCLTFLRNYLDQYEDIEKPADFSSDGEEGLIIEWRRMERYLDLNWPASSSGDPYLYFLTPSTYGVGKPLTAELLRSRLDWLNSED